MARKSTKRPGIESAPASEPRRAALVEEQGMDAGIPSFPGVPVDIDAFIEKEREAQAKHEAEELARYERMVGSQEKLAASILSLVAELERHRLAKGPAPEPTPRHHAEPPLTRSEPKSEPPPNVGKSDGKVGGIAPPTMEDAQRAVLKFLASHEPAEVGKRLAAIGVEKVSTIKGSDVEKATKYAAVIKALE